MEDSRVVTEAPATAAPQRPAQVLTQVIESSDRTSFRIDSKPGGARVFLMLLLTFWSFGCVPIFKLAITTMDWEVALFVVPFVAVWFLVAGLMLKNWRGYETLTVSREGLDYERGSVFGKKSGHLNFAELRSIDVVTITNISKGTTTKLHYIDITTLGLPLRFGQVWVGTINLSQEEADWLKNEMLRAIGLHGGQKAFDRLLGAAEPTKTDQAAPVSDASPASNFVSPELIESPSAVTSTTPLRFRVIDAPDALVVERPYDWAISKMVTLLLFNAFWNSCLTGFLTALVKGQPPGARWWFNLVFLIPFELIGLSLVVWFVAELLGPVRKQVWEISSDRLVRRSCVAMFGRTTQYDPTSITTVRREEMALTESVKVKLLGVPMFTVTAGNDHDRHRKLQALKQQGAYNLVFLDAANKPVLTILFLTELEAGAIERALRSRVPRWFGS